MKFLFGLALYFFVSHSFAAPNGGVAKISLSLNDETCGIVVTSNRPIRRVVVHERAPILDEIPPLRRTHIATPKTHSYEIPALAFRLANDFTRIRVISGRKRSRHTFNFGWGPASLVSQSHQCTSGYTQCPWSDLEQQMQTLADAMTEIESPDHPLRFERDGNFSAWDQYHLGTEMWWDAYYRVYDGSHFIGLASAGLSAVTYEFQGFEGPVPLRFRVALRPDVRDYIAQNPHLDHPLYDAQLESYDFMLTIDEYKYFRANHESPDPEPGEVGDPWNFCSLNDVQSACEASPLHEIHACSSDQI